jgi:hypothetical protein
MLSLAQHPDDAAVIEVYKPYIELRNWHGRIHLGLARLGDEPIAKAAGKT